MMDLAQEIAIDITKHRESSAPDPLILLLPEGAEPKTVYVKAIQSGDTWVAGFALEPAPVKWQTGGVEWQFRSDEVKYGLFISFVFVEGIEELEYVNLLPPGPQFWFSETWAPLLGQKPSQLCCAPVVAHARTTYHFFAKLTNGHRIDPIIVVTPLPGK